MMIGVWGQHAGLSLEVLAVGTLGLFGLPMLFWPLRWAAVLGWRIPEHTHLATYFGRCLGAVICVLGAFAFRVAAEPALQPFFFDLLLGNFVLMVAVHVYGAVKRIQPRSETYEIGYWLLLLVLALMFYPVR